MVVNVLVHSLKKRGWLIHENLSVENGENGDLYSTDTSGNGNLLEPTHKTIPLSIYFLNAKRLTPSSHG